MRLLDVSPVISVVSPLRYPSKGMSYLHSKHFFPCVPESSCFGALLILSKGRCNVKYLTVKYHFAVFKDIKFYDSLT